MQKVLFKMQIILISYKIRYLIFYSTLVPSEQAQKVGVDAQSKCEHPQLSAPRASDLISVQISYCATELY